MSTHQTSLLLVDDEQEFLDGTSRALRRRGFDVQTACGAEEALELVQAMKFDVAVLDVKMPGMDGVELFRRLRARWPWMPVIMLTGHGTVQQAFETSREGVVEYLTKPCDVEVLADTVRDAVALSSAGAAAVGHVQDDIRVLFVDDDTDLLESLSKVMSRRGMKVSTATGGLEALEVLGRAFQDVVVLDVRMPGMDGLEALGRIKRASPTTEVLLLTGHPTTYNAFVGVREGAFDYLVKPYGVDDLWAMIRAAYRHGRLRQEAAEKEGVERVLEGKAD
jgi:DNA-binding NtrC family response regulator